MSDAKTLLPVVARMKERFSVGRVTFIADRGMVSKRTIEELETSETPYILYPRRPDAQCESGQ